MQAPRRSSAARLRPIVVSEPTKKTSGTGEASGAPAQLELPALPPRARSDSSATQGVWWAGGLNAGSGAGRAVHAALLGVIAAPAAVLAPSIGTADAAVLAPVVPEAEAEAFAAEALFAEEAPSADSWTALAQNTAEDPRVQELKTKLGAYVKNHFGGDYKKAFEAFDSSKDGKLNRDELISALKKIGIGNGFTRGMWADGVLERCDKNGDGKVTWAELNALLGSGNSVG